MMSEIQKYRIFLLKFGYWAAIAAGCFVLIKYLLNPLGPFIIALAIAAMLQPLVKYMAKTRRVNKSAVAIVLVVLTYLLLAALLVAIFVGMVSAVIGWASGLPEFFSETIEPWIVNSGDQLIEKVSKYYPEINEMVNDLLPDVIKTISTKVMDFSVSIVSWASNAGTKLPGVMLATVVCVISTVFLAADYEHLTDSIVSRLPEKGQEIVRTAKKALRTIIGSYAKSYSLILLITFAEICVGLFIIGMSNAFIIALIIALFDILPIVGSGMVLLPWTIVLFIQGNIGKGIGLGILWIFVIVIRQIIEPKIIGKHVGLNPLMTLMCMWVGLKLFGGIGMFALPIGLLVIIELQSDGIILTKSKPLTAAAAEKMNQKSGEKPEK